MGSKYGYIPGPDNFLDDEKPNDAEQYNGRVNMKFKKMKGEEKGTVKTGNYGSREGMDNKTYSDRGLKDPDDERIKNQAMPNKRMYSYME